MKMITRLTGRHHEQQAADYLKKQGLQLLEQNYQCRGGEIDLVMRDGDTLVFVEVRYRSRKDHGSAIESITFHKQRKILHTARYYLSQQAQYQNLPCRFDVLGIDKGEPLQYTWLKSAFTE